MKYSNKIVTDNNMDNLLESLALDVGINFNNCEGFFNNLPEGFTKQTHDKGFDEFFNSKILPNKGSDFRQAFEKGLVAYEFGNGFIVLNFECVL